MHYTTVYNNTKTSQAFTGKLTVNMKYYSYNEIILVVLEGSGEGDTTDSSSNVEDTTTAPPTPVSAESTEGKYIQSFRFCMKTHDMFLYLESGESTSHLLCFVTLLLCDMLYNSLFMVPYFTLWLRISPLENDHTI